MMTTQDLINTLRQGKPMTDRLMREIVRELEEKSEQLRTMGTALRAKDADYAALTGSLKDAKEKNNAALRTMIFILNECDWEDFTGDCGDNRIGKAIRETLVRMRIDYE